MAPLLGRAPWSSLVKAEEAAVAAGVRRSGRFSATRTASARGNRGGASAAGRVEEEGEEEEDAQEQELSQSLHKLADMPLNLSAEQTWRERAFLASYVVDAILCAAYDQVLPPLREGNKRPVLLVPGWCGRTKSFRKMAERLAREGYPVYPVPLGSQLGCIDRKAGELSKFLDQHTLTDVYVVAHSMGGLISVRSMMKGETRIRRLITMGTPYRGTHVIYLGYAASILLVLALSFWLSPLAGSIYLGLFLQIPSLWQMQPESGFLTEVLEYLGQVATPVQCVYAVQDQIVVHNWREAWSPTRLGRDDDLCLPEYGHMNLFMGDSGIELVTRLLARYDKKERQTAGTTSAAGSSASSPTPASAKR